MELSGLWSAGPYHYTSIRNVQEPENEYILNIWCKTFEDKCSFLTPLCFRFALARRKLELWGLGDHRRERTIPDVPICCRQNPGEHGPVLALQPPPHQPPAECKEGHLLRRWDARTSGTILFYCNLKVLFLRGTGTVLYLNRTAVAPKFCPILIWLNPMTEFLTQFSPISLSLVAPKPRPWSRTCFWYCGLLFLIEFLRF